MDKTWCVSVYNLRDLPETSEHSVMSAGAMNVANFRANLCNGHSEFIVPKHDHYWLDIQYRQA